MHDGSLTPAFPPRSLCETDASYRLDRLLRADGNGVVSAPLKGRGLGGVGAEPALEPEVTAPVFGGFQSHLHGHRHLPDRAPSRPGRLSPDLPTALSTSPVRATVTPPGARAGAWGGRV